MKISRLFLSVICLTISINAASCSSEKDSWFQTNDKPADFNLFAIFDDYPSIKDGWDKVEADVFNSGLAELINNTPVDRLKAVLGLMDDMVLDPDEPFFNTLEILRQILGKIVNQDTLDAETGSTTYYSDFLSFMETMSASNANFSENLVPIVSNLLMYINVTKDTMNDETEITELTNDLLYMMQEQVYDNNSDAQNIHYFLPIIQEAMGKLLMRNNQNMYVDNTALPAVTQRQDISAIDSDDVDTGLGNTVAGLNSVVYGLNQLSQQAPDARTNLFEALRELGRLTSKDANGKLFKNVVKELLINLEDYYTAGGTKAANPDYNRDENSGGVRYYVNSDITNTVRELWPAVQLLMIRSKKGTDPAEKPDFSIIKDEDGRSPLEIISKSLGRLYDIGIDFGTGGLESSLAEMVEKNAIGEDRNSADASYLDRLLFTLSIASNFGYKTRLSDSGEPQTNHGRGHGYSTGGIMTLNDSMYNMRSNVFMEQNAYTLALDKRLMQGYGVSRHSSSFTSVQSASH